MAISANPQSTQHSLVRGSLAGSGADSGCFGRNERVTQLNLTIYCPCYEISSPPAMMNCSAPCLLPVRSPLLFSFYTNTSSFPHSSATCPISSFPTHLFSFYIPVHPPTHLPLAQSVRSPTHLFILYQFIPPLICHLPISSLPVLPHIIYSFYTISFPHLPDPRLHSKPSSAAQFNRIRTRDLKERSGNQLTVLNQATHFCPSKKRARS